MSAKSTHSAHGRRRCFDDLAEDRLPWNAMPDVYERVSVDGLYFAYVSGQDCRAMDDDRPPTAPQRGLAARAFLG
jgi:hypothetical protein